MKGIKNISWCFGWRLAGLLSLVLIQAHVPRDLARASTIADSRAENEAGGTVDGSWLAIPPPSGRYGHCAIYDPLRDRMIVFGGNDGVRRDQVWSLSFAGAPTWTLLSPTGTGPTRRYNHSAIYDPIRDRMIVFGGDDGADLNDVWALSLSGTPSWSQLVPSGTPPAGRYSSSVIYDAAGDRMIVFGGKTGALINNDAWALLLSDPPTWSELAAPAPPPSRYRHSAIYDPVRNRMVVFGGDDGNNELSDTWSLSLSGSPAWSLIMPSDTIPPRREHVAIYDPGSDRMVVLGGGSDENSTWTLPLSGAPSWSRLSTTGVTPAWRFRHAGVFDSQRNRLIVFGGEGNTNDVEALSLSGTPTWEILTQPGTQIGARQGHTAVYDPVRDRMIVFGGNHHVFYHDTWTLSLGETLTWSAVFPSGVHPSQRVGHSTIYDPMGDRLIVFGGLQDGAILNDVWSLSLSGAPSWSQLTVSGAAPRARQGHTAIYDPVRHRMIVFGGRAGTTGDPTLGDIWELSLTGTPRWSQLASIGTNPGPRFWHTAIYDPVRNRMIVHGGDDGTTSHSGAWALSLTGIPTWSALTTTNVLPFLIRGHSAIYDPVKDRMVVFGGVREAPVGTLGDDAWSLSLSGMPAWSQLIPSGGRPTGRLSHTAIYDPVRDRMVLFGGFVEGVYVNDTWLLSWNAPTKPSAACPSELIWTAGTPLEASYQLSNPLATERAVEWKLESERQWPGFPLRGLTNVAGSATETLTVQVPVPDTAAAGSNALRLTVAFAGAAGNDSTCDHVILDATTPTLASLVSAEATPGRVRLAWRVTASGRVTVQRRDAATPWSAHGESRADGSGDLVYEDHTVEYGERYGYRLAWTDGDGDVFAGEVWVEVPSHYELALQGVRPNPVAGTMAVSLTLPHAGRVNLELYDVRGRRMEGGRELVLSAGHHVLPIAASSRLAPGVYVVRVGFAGRTLQTRAVVIK